MLDESTLEGFASFLQETKYKDLNNLKKHKSIDDVRKSAYSQGYDVSKPRKGVGDHYVVDVTHRKTGEKVKPSSGGTHGGSHTGRKGGVDTTFVNQTSSSIKKDRERRGGVDKTPQGKAKRAQQARRISKPNRPREEHHSNTRLMGQPPNPDHLMKVC